MTVSPGNKIQITIFHLQTPFNDNVYIDGTHHIDRTHVSEKLVHMGNGGIYI